MSTMWKEITDILHMDPANSDLAAPPFWSHAVWFAVTRAVFMLSDVVLE